MAVSPQAKNKPRQAAADSSFISDLSLLRSLSQDISSLSPLRFILTANSASLIRKFSIFNHLFDHLYTLYNHNRPSHRPTFRCLILCLEEMCILLHRTKTLIQRCAAGSVTWLVMQSQTVAHTFRELAVDMSTLLDVFPIQAMDDADVLDIVQLARKQCYQTDASLAEPDDKLRSELLATLDEIKRGIVPEQSGLSSFFLRLGLSDSAACGEEIERLDEEFFLSDDDQSKSELIAALIGLVRFAKCVLYGPGSTNRRRNRRRISSTAEEVNMPSDFRCPISLELMRDPVVVSTGQTYDRASINLWLQSGHDTCPKTGQTLAHTHLIPNLALKSFIAFWCREHMMQAPFEASSDRVNSVVTSKTAVEATRMTVSFLVNKLASAPYVDEDVNGLVYELRALAKTDADSRASIAEAGGIPLLVRHIGSDHPSLQVNAVTTILNLSILESNKARIVETEGAVNGLIEVLRSGVTWEAKGNAAATIFSLSSVHAYRKRLGRKPRVVKGLLDLAREGPVGSKRDAFAAVTALAGDREAVGKLLDGGVVGVAAGVMDVMAEEAVAILEMVVKRGGVAAVAATYHVIRRLGAVLRDYGSDQARESAAATLVIMCRKGGAEAVAELAAIPGIERVIWELMGSGTARARRKSASLLRMLRRWAAGLDGEVAAAAVYSTRNVTPTSRALLLPS